MVQICEGLKTKQEMLLENVEKYKEMYMRTKNEINRIIEVGRHSSTVRRVSEQKAPQQSVGNRLQGNAIDYEADFLDIAPAAGVNRGGRGNGLGRGRGGRVERERGRAVGRDDDRESSDDNDDRDGRRGPRGRGAGGTKARAPASGRGRRPPPPPPPAAAAPAQRTRELEDDELECKLLLPR